MSRYLGQHFLIAKRKIGKIVESLELKDKDVIIEIGPGKSALTIPLCENCRKLGCKIIAVEKDKLLANNLKEKFKNDKNVEIIEGDVLKILSKTIIQFNNLSTGNYKIVGNIPYYITGYLLRTFGELEIKPSLIILTIQKEVAERIIVKPPKMNLLAASVQFWAEPKIIGYVSRKDFSPPPKVDSAIIELKIKNYELRIKDNYYRIIKILFKQPRKTILNNLLSGIGDKNKEEIVEKLKKAGIDPRARPQNLSIEQIIELSTLF
ncbi:MAG: Ribosomal RNA small subunit methyltransferase A [Candidatus Wolfebacteria bacterium GW2011_GWA2_42_10]|uniref:Ribosomal RNA small subunit methyltransferase A n=2 Tax=Candidatus Wolfeibacteriota TaxID=1752735 RepID=A0A0G0XK90_9BACT|nr:MAG: Ribosomal RNA small subunit methyltransferase A [Candidatus Wolfebacteria bacterium GW2011_GWB1_41_12]KKS25340.1 MAG: Ribosomal RNA small subunit methyltransferase A [Candidatus Wolfebacteria bacterium GW2011_GWA2_42_10]KKT56779.1 MAG: Ribosomal RNA small subunit methyltransferase A [Candidatus Wolfebacteria bacterium GW2011_GWA1_44_24]